MKKNYFYSLFAALMLFVAMPATAQVVNTDLYGKWKFSATLEFGENVTDAQKALFSGDCDVVISKDENGIWDAKIVGFAGSQNPQYVHSIVQSSTSGKYAAKIQSPDPYGAPLFEGMRLANAEGHNPYNHFVPNGEKDEEGKELGDWVSYGDIFYVLNDEKNEMTVPDFTVVTVTDYNAHQANIIAKFTNVKMTLVEAAAPEAPVEVADISGEYIFKAGNTTYSTMPDSEIPTEFAVNIVKKSDDNKNYEATIAIEGYDNVTLPATFDGLTLTLEFNAAYIYTDATNEENSIRFADANASTEKKGVIEFKKNDSGFSNFSGFSFVTDFMEKNKEGEMEAATETAQWYIDGTLKLASETPDAPAFDWAGVYTVKVDSKDIEEEVKVDMAWPTEFQMEISAWGEDYCITKFMGFDLSNYQGGLFIDILADGTGATIDLTQYYSMAPIKSNGDGTYWVLTDKKGAATELKLALNADGTLAIDDFSISNHSYGTEDFEDIVYYNNVAIEKYVAPAFNWAGTYKLEAKNVVAKDGGNYPSEFYVTVIYDPSEAYPEYAGYYVVDFMGNDIGPMNYGGIPLEVAEDGNSANLANGNVYSLGEGNYLKIYDAAVTGTPISATLGENGVVAMADFAIAAAASADAVVVEYKEVTLKKVLGAPVLVHPDTSKEINSLEYYRFYFGEKVNVDLEYPGGLSLMKGEEKVADFKMSWTEVYPDGYVVFTSEKVTAPGKYTLELPAGLVTAADGKEFVGAKYEFTVVAKAPSYSINPNGSADVNSIEKITIKCENVAEIAVDEAKKVWLTSGSISYQGVVVKSENNIEITFKLDGEEVAKIEEEGEYVLTLPEGLFTMKGLDDSEVVYVGEELTFNVVAPSAVAPLEVANVEVLADGSINIVYNQPVASAWDADGKTHSQTIIITNENGDELTLLQSASWTVNNTMRYISADSEYNGLEYVVAPLPAGTYTIDVSQVILNYAGTEIFGDGWSAWEWSTTGAATGAYTFTVEAVDTAIDGVEAEVENDVIYDLTGRRVNEITKAGIYIVNGKKVLVK